MLLQDNVITNQQSNVFTAKSSRGTIYFDV